MALSVVSVSDALSNLINSSNADFLLQTQYDLCVF